MTTEKNKMLLQAKDTFLELSKENFMEWTDEQVLTELSNFEIMLDTNEVCDCCLMDIILEMSDSLRDECVRRFHKSVIGEK